MRDRPVWLPNLICLEDFHGQWLPYERAIRERFDQDFLCTDAVFDQRFLVKPGFNCFWKVCSDSDPDAEERVLSIRRCERIGWIRPIIEHADDDWVYAWEEPHGKERRIQLLLHFDDEHTADHLVVLTPRRSSCILITSYPIDRPRRGHDLLRRFEDYGDYFG